ncbi:MAG TPA: hypothetical protein V6C81_24695 [Planktothrix sp.]|jgi:hypothetical protein
MADNTATINPLVEQAIVDHKSNDAAFKTDIAKILTADLGSPQKLAQDAKQLEQQLQMKPADLENLGFPADVFSNEAGSSPAAASDAKTAPPTSSDSSALNGAHVSYDSQNRPDDVKYPNGMEAKVTYGPNGEITEASIAGSPDPTYNGTFQLQSDGLLHGFDDTGKSTGVTVKPGDVSIGKDGAVQVLAKQKEAFLSFSGYIEVDPEGDIAKHTGTPPTGTPS